MNNQPDIFSSRDLVVIGIIVGYLMGALFWMVPGHVRVVGSIVLLISTCAFAFLCYTIWKDRRRWKPSE
jgi:hypothetical protein